MKSSIRAAADRAAACLQDVPDDTTVPCYLPEQVIATVLRHVDQKERLTVCARVCRSWAEAAVTATESVHLDLAGAPAAERRSRAERLSEWLQQHPRQVEELQVCGNYLSRPQLLLSGQVIHQLQRLALTDCKVTITATGGGHIINSSSTPNHSRPLTAGAGGTAGHALYGSQQHKHTETPTSSSGSSRSSSPSVSGGLTSLLLCGCVLEWRHSLPAAVCVRNLRQLHLQQLLPAELSRSQQQALQHLVPAAFTQLTQLTQLVLKHLYQYESVLLAGLTAGLGHMQHLQNLQVDMLQLTAAALAQMPTSLTQLHLEGAKQLMLSSAAVAGLSRLSDLQQLRVEGVRRFEPHILCYMPKLKGLRLRSSSSRFLPDGPQGTQDLLAAIQGLHDLENLDLRNVLQHVLPGEQLQAYSGLTSSSQLAYLDLSTCRFPPNSDGLVFTASCCLPFLQQLVLYRCEDPGGAALHLQDLGALVECCPGLQHLSLWLSNPHSSSNSSHGNGSSCSSSMCAAGHQLQPLTALSCLTRLVAAGPGVIPPAVSVITQLQQLSSLSLFRCRHLTHDSMLGLTRLSGLTSLVIDVPRFYSAGLRHPGEYMLLQGPQFTVVPCSPVDQGNSQQVQARQDPNDVPVWLQLQRLCLSGRLMEAPADFQAVFS